MTVTISQSVEDNIVETVKTVEQFVVDTVRTWADAVSSLVPDLSALPLEQLPDSSEMSDRAMAFAERVVATQRRFVANLYDAISPIVDAAKGTAPETV